MKIRLLHLLVLTFSFFASTTVAQEENDIIEEVNEEEYYEEEEFYYSRQSEVGLDFTPLISKLVPFNLSEVENGLIGLKYKRYKRTHAFRLSLGAKLEDRLDTNNFLYFSMGYEKRKTLTTQWSYVTGWEFVTFFEENQNFRDESFIGFNKFFGFEYNISDNIFLAAEASLSLLWSDDETNIQFNVPQSIFFFIRF